MCSYCSVTHVPGLHRSITSTGAFPCTCTATITGAITIRGAATITITITIVVGPVIAGVRYAAGVAERARAP
jgi:hypothetical protein